MTTKVKEVLVDENLRHGIQVKCGLISDGFRVQGSKEGKPIAVSIYDERFVDYLAILFKQHVENRYDNKVLMTGPSGSGKTTEAITLARKMDPDLPQDNVTFRLKDFRERLALLKEADPTADRYPVCVLDESGVDLYSKDWMKTHTKEFSKVFQIIRKKKLTMICCLPHRLLLTRDIRDAMHWWFDMQVMHQYRGCCVVREAKVNPWYPPWWRPLAAYTFDELTDDFWQRYEERKDTFIDEFTREDDNKILSVRAQKLIDQRDKCIRELRRKGMSVREIETLTGLDDGGISRIANADKERKRGEREAALRPTHL